MRTFDLRSWVRQHSRMSVHTLRRRFPLTREEAEDTMAQLIEERIVYANPEGESYRVVYPLTRRGRAH